MTTIKTLWKKIRLLTNIPRQDRRQIRAKNHDFSQCLYNVHDLAHYKINDEKHNTMRTRYLTINLQ